MSNKIIGYLTLSLLFLLSGTSGNTTPPGGLDAPQGFNPGPDIITGDMGVFGVLAQFGSNGTQVGLGISTTCCNAGNQVVNFSALPATNHPVIPHNLYRMSGGAGNNERFEQIGQSWVKHAFGADQVSDCFQCQPGGDLGHLGVGCSDTYASEQNATQVDLGSRALINPFTGVFQSTANNHSGHVHTGTSHRILVEGSDLNTTLNPGATYYAEVQYVSSDEYAWCQSHPGQCNMYNNASYCRYNVSGTTSFTFSIAGDTVRMSAAITAWPGATINPIEPEPGADGRAYLACKVTNPSAGVWHYEYALYNENLDRAIQSFSVPLGCAITLSNFGFHAPLNHPGFPNDGTQGDAGFSNAAWVSNQTNAAVSWSTETFAQNQNANAIRWGTLYNFRFDSDKPPVATSATIGFFKTGAPVRVAILGPNACNASASPSPTPPVPTPTPPATPSPIPTPFPTPILPPGGNGKIAFYRLGEIYVMDADGANQTNLMHTPRGDVDPAWSPDGTKIVYAETPATGPTRLYIMNANGSNQVALTDVTGYAYDPSWSPDGTKIAYTRNSSNGVNVYVIGTNGSNPVNLTNGDSSDPAWSPDGGKIAFVARLDGGGAYQVYVMNANGSNPTRLTAESAEAFQPAWSPDGTKVAYATSTGNIYVISAYGTNRTRLTNMGTDSHPAWSPDGTKIAFNRTVGTSSLDIFVMNANGSNQIPITNTAGANAPEWQRVAATPAPAAQALNLSTRMRVLTGDNVGIGGFVVTGIVPKQVLLRAIGPSLAQSSVPDALADPVLELHGPTGFATITNDNWRETQEAAIMATGIPPSNDLESAIVATLDGGSYTAIVRGKNNTTGVGLIEAYDLNPVVETRLANISTRAFVGTGSDIVIAGFILGGQTGNTTIVLRGLGLSLTQTGVANPLPDPTMQLRDGNGALLMSNDNWPDDASQSLTLIAWNLEPQDNHEAAMVVTPPPGVYTALLSGMNNTTGVGLVEVYELGPH